MERFLISENTTVQNLNEFAFGSNMKTLFEHYKTDNDNVSIKTLLDLYVEKSNEKLYNKFLIPCFSEEFGYFLKLILDIKAVTSEILSYIYETLYSYGKFYESEGSTMDVYVIEETENFYSIILKVYKNED